VTCAFIGNWDAVRIKHQASSIKREASSKVQSAGKQNEEKLWEKEG